MSCILHHAAMPDGMGHLPILTFLGGKVDFIRIETVGDVTVVTFTTGVVREDRIIRSIFDRIEALLKEGARKMIVNFSGVESFTAYGIGRLLALNAECDAAGKKLVLCCLTPIIDEIVDVMSIRRRFRIVRTRDEALVALQSS